MQVRVTLKDPDGFYDCVRDAVKESIAELEGLSNPEKESLLELRLEKTWDKLETFVDCQEYVTIVFDTDAGTAAVEKRK